MYPPNIADVRIRRRESHFSQKFCKNSKILASKILLKGDSVGYTVKCMEKDFTISNYPLEQTEFLYDSKQGMDLKSDCDSRKWTVLIQRGQQTCICKQATGSSLRQS